MQRPIISDVVGAKCYVISFMKSLQGLFAGLSGAHKFFTSLNASSSNLVSISTTFLSSFTSLAVNRISRRSIKISQSSFSNPNSNFVESECLKCLSFLFHSLLVSLRFRGCF